MLICELQPEQEITIQVRIGENTLTFPTKVQENLPKKNAIIADAVIKEDKPISFKGSGVIVNVLVTFSDEKPLLFKHVTIKLLKKKENTYCYFIHSSNKIIL